MSVIVTANYDGETFEVEVFRNGSLEFPGRDTEHEQTLAALGGDKSIAIRFDEEWTRSPTNVIFGNTELPENSASLLAADYAEHVLLIYEREYPKDRHPRDAVDAVRKYVAGEIDRATLEKARTAAEAAAWAAAAWTAARAAAWAAEAARAAAWAVAYNVSPDQNSVEWQQAHDVEVAWQVRRFVDCMEAVGRGLPWPPLEATE